MKQRTHPITILELVSKYLFLLLIPVLRGLFYLLTTSHDFYNWLSGAWLDLLVVLFILLASYLRWHFQFYRYDEQGLTVHRGILLRRTVTIPESSISTLAVEESFYLRPLSGGPSAGRYRCGSLSAGRLSADPTQGRRPPPDGIP